jgi:conjugal transfer pilus assembly protein TraU
MKRLLFLFIFLIVFLKKSFAGAFCNAAGFQSPLLNPITTINWSCIFPIVLGGIRIPNPFGYATSPLEPMAPTYSQLDFNTIHTPLTICMRQTPVGPIPVPAIPVGLWIPIGIIEIVRTEWCSPSLNTMLGSPSPVGQGTRTEGGEDKNSFYNVHFIAFPLGKILDQLMDFVCINLTGLADIDYLYLSEIDITWHNDLISLWENPEALLFNNPVINLACAADCASATSGFPNDALVWCNGCLGNVYPFSGHITGDTRASAVWLRIAAKLVAKMSRYAMLRLTTTPAVYTGACVEIPTFFWVKHQYKFQFVFPVQSVGCYPPGVHPFAWETLRQIPAMGEDAILILWIKKECPLL